MKELKEAKQNLTKQLENTKIANECGLTTKGEFSKDIKAIETVLNYIENSISKEVIEKKIEKLENQREKATEQNQMGTGIMLTGGINYLQELLEE